jgi:arsenate reductase
MAEIGIDISKNRSKNIEEFRGSNFNYVVTVCDSARESCPFFPGEKIIHKAFKDLPNSKGRKRRYLRELDESEKKSENG